jgi:penicillin-binding protein 2
MKEERKFVIQGIFIAIGAIFLIRLFYLQVIDDSYKYAADNNVVKPILEYPNRGQIYDRNGKLIVINGPVYDISFIPKKTKIKDTLRFCQDMGITRGAFDTLLMEFQKDRKIGRASMVKPYILFKQVSNVDFARMQDHLIDYPGLEATARTIRSYPHGALANTLGYIGEVGKKQLEEQEEPYYRQGDYIGVSGLESKYEEYLRGRRGVKYVLENVKGIVKGSFKNGEYDTLALPGEPMVSTIDLDLQQYAESLMVNKIGSIVAIEPSTGEILAMVSSPSYDPNLLTGRDMMKNFVPLQKNPYIPLYNRPIQAIYRPGSIFKVLQALVGLQEGSITPSTVFPCGAAPVKCHPHPSGDLTNGIRYSCNPYFYNVFRRTMYSQSTGNNWKDSEQGLLRWRKHIMSFGLGQKTGVDLPNEKRGLIPDTSVFNRKYGRLRWQFSNLYSMGIGEGELGVTPIQMANFAATIANRGYYYKPHLIKSIGGKNGKPLPEYLVRNQTTIDSVNFAYVIEGMEMAVAGGTVWSQARLKDIVMCGKTGTSQNGPGQKDHSAFIAFAPKYNPQIAIAAYVENAGFGGIVAAPIASLVIEKYIKKTIERKNLEKWMLSQSFMPVRKLAPDKKTEEAKKKEEEKKVKEEPKAKTAEKQGNKAPQPQKENQPKPDTAKRPAVSDPIVRRAKLDKGK